MVRKLNRSDRREIRLMFAVYSRGETFRSERNSKIIREPAPIRPVAFKLVKHRA
jgi:hypothetical protein